MGKKRRPWIGFVGLVLLLIGGCGAYNEAGTYMGWLALAGGIILIVALFTGQVKLFG